MHKVKLSKLWKMSIAMANIIAKYCFSAPPCIFFSGGLLQVLHDGQILARTIKCLEVIYMSRFSKLGRFRSLITNAQKMFEGSKSFFD